MAKIIHKQLSFDVVGCAQKVHSVLGPGFPESVYHRALCVELAKSKIPFESEKSVEVWYEGNLCGTFRMDIVVDEKVVLELKALNGLVNDHLGQALSYLKATGLNLAIILNFGCRSLEIKRVVL